MNHIIISGQLLKFSNLDEKTVIGKMSIPVIAKDRELFFDVNFTALGKAAAFLTATPTVKESTFAGRVANNTDMPSTLVFYKTYESPLYGLNSFVLVGRAGRDPEVRYLESGSMVANFSMAVNRMKAETPDWINVEVWGTQAQVAADYVRKGSLVGVTGTFKLDCWTDRATGEDRSKPVIRVDTLELLGGRRDSDATKSNANEEEFDGPL
jgi:single-strand DNA-binding protein